MNAFCRHICGRLADGIVRRSFEEAAWWREFEDVKEKTALAIKTVLEDAVATDEVAFLDKHRQVRHVLRIFSPIKNTHNDIRQISVVGFDISQRKREEEALRESEQRLRAIIGNVNDSIYARGFNNVLFPIVGLSELLMEDLPKDSVQYKNAREILRDGNRGAELVKQILAFSRQTEHKKMPVRPQQILEEVLKLIRSTIPSSIKINRYIQSDCGLIDADPTQIHQVAMNLITNAYHAVEQQGDEISITLKKAKPGHDSMP